MEKQTLAIMEKILENHVYYRIESPRGVMSDAMTENDLEACKKRGYFTMFIWRGEEKEAYDMKRYKIGKIFKYTRLTTLTEEII